MTDAKAGSEPSMEEILASIRQIINQNDKPADGVAVDAPAADASPSAAAPASMPVQAPAMASDAAAVDEAPEDEEVLELTDILAETPAPPPVVEMMEAAAAFAPAPVSAPAAAPVAPAAPAAPIMPAPVVQAVPQTELISNTSAAAATAALSSLATTLQQEKMEHSLPLGNGMRTLESMAVEALKPLLKDWLDANLPAIVERIVQQEVEKLTKRLGA